MSSLSSMLLMFSEVSWSPPRPNGRMVMALSPMSRSCRRLKVEKKLGGR